MLRSIHTLVYGLAALHDDDPLLAEALRIAAHLGATLHVVHTFQLPDPVADAFAGMIGLGAEEISSYRDAQRERVEAFLRAAIAAGAPTPAAAPVCHAEPGPAERVLLAIAERVGAGLLLIGATRRGTLASTILGTTAQRVVRGAQVPLLVLREPLARRAPRVLLTTDLSALSAAVHERALDTVEALWDEAPELRSLNVTWHAPLVAPMLSAVDADAAAVAELREFLARRAPRRAAVQARVALGDAAKEIVREAAEWDADLLVLGTHGRGGASRLLLGSVAEAVLRTVLGNVLVIPAACVADEPRQPEER